MSCSESTEDGERELAGGQDNGGLRWLHLSSCSVTLKETSASSLLFLSGTPSEVRRFNSRIAGI